MIEYVITIASIVTAVTVISTACFNIYKFFRKLENKYILSHYEFTKMFIIKKYYGFK